MSSDIFNVNLWKFVNSSTVDILDFHILCNLFSPLKFFSKISFFKIMRKRSKKEIFKRDLLLFQTPRVNYYNIIILKFLVKLSPCIYLRMPSCIDIYRMSIHTQKISLDDCFIFLRWSLIWIAKINVCAHISVNTHTYLSKKF